MSSLFERLHLPSPAGVRELLARCGVSPWRLGRSGAFATAATLFQLVALALFLPLVQVVLGSAPSGGGRLGRLLPAASLEEITGGGRSTWPLLVLVLGATALRMGCGYAADLLVARERSYGEARVQAALLRRFLGLGQTYYDGAPVDRSARMAQRLPAQLARGVDVLHDAIASGLGLVLTCAALLLLSWPLAIVAITGLLLYHLFYARAAERLERMAEQLESVEDDAGSRAHDLLANLPLVHAHGARDLEADRLARQSVALAGLRLGEARLLGLLEPMRDGLAILLLLGVAGLVAALPHTAATAGATRYLVFLLVARRALSSASKLLRVPERWRRIERAREKLDELELVGARFPVRGGARPFVRLEHSVAVDGLSFAYPGGREVLHDLNLRFAAGRRTWLVGASGSGKSTLLKLLIRLYDCPPGTIRLDGVDLLEFSTSSIVSSFGWAPSEPLFLADTVRANLSYGLERTADDEIWRLAEAFAVAEMLRELPAGLDTDLGERGLRFSTGERQRLALVRLFLRRPCVLLFDEATSGLDAATEQRVLSAIRSFTAGCTVIAVAHRLSSMDAGDDVAVFERGRVVEYGRRDELLERGGALRALFAARALPLPVAAPRA